jgi:signal transduction histidine kinase
MLSLFTRRVALSVYRSTAVYTPILSSSAPALRYRRILDGNPHARTVQSAASLQRSVSTKATAVTDDGKSKESERRKKAEKAAALRAKLKAQAEKKKEAARKKLTKEKERKKLAREKEKKKPKRMYITVSCEVLYSTKPVVPPSHQSSS